MKIRTYDKEFKLNAVKMLKTKNSGAELCRDLGIPTTTFYTWVKEYGLEGENSFSGSGNIKDSNQELFQLKKELENAKMERDILKKALAIFSKQRL